MISRLSELPIRRPCRMVPAAGFPKAVESPMGRSARVTSPRFYSVIPPTTAMNKEGIFVQRRSEELGGS